jgi:hypothetical protein
MTGEGTVAQNCSIFAFFPVIKLYDENINKRLDYKKNALC